MQLRVYLEMSIYLHWRTQQCGKCWCIKILNTMFHDALLKVPSTVLVFFRLFVDVLFIICVASFAES
jgi:hypothetical protein